MSLISLESARERTCPPEPDAGAVHDQVTAAISSLRKAVEELRALHATHTSTLAHGFVMAASPENTPNKAEA